MAPARANRENLGFLLAKASQRWNELLQEGFARAGFPEVRASYGSVLVPLFEEDGLRMGEIAARSRLSKQTMTTLVRLTERDGLTERRPDLDDARAVRVYLTARGQAALPVAEQILAEIDGLAARALGVRRAPALARSLSALAGMEHAADGLAAA